MYEQVKRRLWAVSQGTFPPSLSSATPLFIELQLDLVSLLVRSATGMWLMWVDVNVAERQNGQKHFSQTASNPAAGPRWRAPAPITTALRREAPEKHGQRQQPRGEAAPARLSSAQRRVSNAVSASVLGAVPAASRAFFAGLLAGRPAAGVADRAALPGLADDKDADTPASRAVYAPRVQKPVRPPRRPYCRSHRCQFSAGWA